MKFMSEIYVCRLRCSTMKEYLSDSLYYLQI